ncbi:DUF2147 domain-containing protein [Salegentibacter chungangensis]|uniref:DUF2147 domain-containing protein n=1 Tax=Salegentibacter chungangensis TaxID=1335724 RepID=A0ABW3NU57_9FLAO
MNVKNNLFWIFFIALSSMSAQSQDVFGKWEVTNDEGKVNSIIHIYKKGDEVYGKVVRIMKEEDRDRICDQCTGELKDKPIEGMNLIRGFEKDGDEYVNGVLTDPKTGKEYKGKIWVDEDNPDKLKVRGYIAFFYKTKTWDRAK